MTDKPLEGALISDQAPPHEAAGGADWPKPIYAWFVVFMLVLAYAIATLDRVVIGLIIDPMKRDLGLSDTGISLLIGLAFSVFYTLFGLPIGMLIDRTRRVSVLGAGILIWSAATAACGFAKNFVGLFVSRVFVGIGEASVTPASSSLIADYFPPERRAKAFGVLMIGGSIGTSMAYLLGSFTIQITGWLHASWDLLDGFKDWQLVFLLAGLSGIVLGGIFLLTVREPARREKGSGEKLNDKPSGVPVKELISALWFDKLAYLAIIGGTVMNVFLISAQLSWYPTLFIRVHGLSPEEIGGLLAMIGFPAGIISALSSGFIMSWFASKGRDDGPIIILAVQATLWGSLGVAKCLAPTVPMSLAFHFVTSLTAMWGVPAVMMGISQITRNRLRGQMSAIYSLLVGLIAVTLGPLAVGVLSDTMFRSTNGIIYSLSTVYAFGGIVGVGFLLIGWKDFTAAAKRSRS